MQRGGPLREGAEGGRRRRLPGRAMQAGPDPGAGPAVVVAIERRPERALRAGWDPGGGMGSDGEDAVQPVPEVADAAAGEERCEGGPLGVGEWGPGAGGGGGSGL